MIMAMPVIILVLHSLITATILLLIISLNKSILTFIHQMDRLLLAVMYDNLILL